MKLSATTKAEASWFLEASKAPRLRTMREFAEQEIVIPDGPFEGRRFSVHRQPYAGLWLDAVDSGRWRRVAATGPSQSGKSLLCSVLPVLYHLFEHKETVIFGLPDMEMAADKWREDLLPVIERSRYHNQLPRSGAGSKGGKFDAITFRNGATLKFMSGGGSDQSRAGFTSRVLVVTEADGLDTASSTSREADKLRQMEARTRAWGERARIYLECTVSTEQGRIWREYRRGTCSKIVTPCPHCGAWVSLEREDLRGHEEAADEYEAKDNTAFHCSACHEEWTEPQRFEANVKAKLLHAGQEIDAAGEISGEPRRTETLGFRWSAVNNMFTAAGQHGLEEWLAARSDDAENAEKERLQFAWARPYKPPKWEANPLNQDEIIVRFHEPRVPRGMVPDGCELLCVGADLRMTELHYVVLAADWDLSALVMEYSVLEIKSRLHGVQQAMTDALWQFHEILEAGFAVAGAESRPPDHVWIDSNYQPDILYDFLCEVDSAYKPILGCGVGKRFQRRYRRPKKKTAEVLMIGHEWHVAKDPDRPLPRIDINVDHWKGIVHESFALPKGPSGYPPGAFTLFSASPREHQKYARHLMAEVEIEEFVPGVGMVKKFDTKSRNNHWLDCTTYAAAAASYGGARRVLIVPDDDPEPDDTAPPKPPGITMPDGRPYLITERED